MLVVTKKSLLSSKRNYTEVQSGKQMILNVYGVLLGHTLGSEAYPTEQKLQAHRRVSMKK